MTLKETGFRALYHNFCVFPLNKKFKDCMKEYPNIEKANCMLVYGYIDTQAGLTLEVLAAGDKKGDSYRFYDTSKEARFFIRAGAVEDTEFAYFEDVDDFKARYAEKLDVLKAYEAGEEVEKTREMRFLDESRHLHYPDDVAVFLTRKGLQPERCWARIIGLGDHWIMATLLNEPNQNFGYHSGEKIAFFVQETEDKHVICYSDMTPSKKITAEDLADGTMLKAAVSAFNAERNEPNFFEVLETLRDSYVWIPCNAVLGEADMAAMQKAIEESGDDLSAMVGQTFTNTENIRMIPDILQNGDAFFFPIFSSAEEMGEYGQGFSKIEKHFLEALQLAINNEKNVSGMVLNAFTEPFVLEREIFDIVQNMKSRIEGEE